MHHLFVSRRVLGALAVVAGAGLLLLNVGTAQPPPPKDGPKPPPRDGGRAEPVKADAAVEAWVKLLAEKMTDRHNSIRESARQALVAVGRPALPVLRRLAESADGAAAEAARKVMARIEQGPGIPGFAFGPPPGFPPQFGGPPPGGPGGFPGQQGGRPGGAPQGGPGRGPGGPGGPGGGGPPGLGGPDRIGQVLRDLNLSEEQQAKVHELLDAHQQKARAMFDQVHAGKLEPQEVRAAHAKLHEELLDGMKGVLYKEQYKKFEAATKEHQPGGPPPGPAGGPRERGAPEGVPPGVW